MITRSEIEKDIRKAFGATVGLLSLKQIKEYTSFGKDRVQTLIMGLPYWGDAGGKRYAVIDVAERLSKSHNKWGVRR